MKDKIIDIALKDAHFSGWSMDGLRAAAKKAGQKPQMADALFSDINTATKYISIFFDARMMQQLERMDTDNMRVRDKIAAGVQTRLDLMAPYRDGLRIALAHYARPLRSLRAAKPLWASADQIWTWAGDVSSDYNRYTKRALLSGVMASTMLFWLQDNSPGNAATRQFLDRRIGNVLSVGKMIGSLRKKAA